MTTQWDRIWTFDTARFTIKCDVAEDLDTDLSWDDDGSVRRGLDDGRLVAFQVRMSVTFDGYELFCDYLGGCIYKSYAEFIDHRGVHGSTYFSDMVRAATRAARATVLKLQSVKVRNVAA